MEQKADEGGPEVCKVWKIRQRDGKPDTGTDRRRDGSQQKVRAIRIDDNTYVGGQERRQRRTKRGRIGDAKPAGLDTEKQTIRQRRGKVIKIGVCRMPRD